jgi:hypothetical protein
MFGFGKKTAPATAPTTDPATGVVKKTGYSFGFGTNTLRQKAARAAAQSSGVGPQWTYFNYTTGLFEVDIVRVGKPNFTISGKDATELQTNYLSGMKNTQSSGVGLGANAARAAAEGTAAAAKYAAGRAQSVAKGTAQRVAGVANVLYRGKQALKGGRTRRNRRNRREPTRRNRRN